MYLVNFPSNIELDQTFLATDRIRTGVGLVGVMDGLNLAFSTVERFSHNLPFLTIEVYYNGVRLTLLNDYTISESGGLGTGYDTVILVTAPLPGDHLTTNYVVP